MSNSFMRFFGDLAGSLGLGLDIQTGTIFGTYGGYSVLLVPADSTRSFTLSVGVSRGGEMPELKAMRSLVPASKAVTGCTVQGYRVNYTIKPGRTKKKGIANVHMALEAMTDFLRQNGYQNCCQHCGAVEKTEAYSSAGVHMLLCPDCYAERCRTAATREVQKNQKKENVVGGIVGALLGSLLGVAAIVLLGQMGYVAALSGIILGVCTLKGYELLGGRLSKKGIVISVVLMIAMVYVGNRIDWSISVLQYFEGLDILTAFRSIPVLLDGGYLDAGSYYGNLALVYLFTAVGAVPNIVNMLRAKKEENVNRRLGAAPESAMPPEQL